jgi:mercuric ion binding protein
MKKFLTAIVLFAFAQNAQSQVMQQKAVWATISVPQMKCWTCRERLDNYLLKEKGPEGDAGILKWTINMNSATIRIQYVPDRINLDYIRTAINNAGFDADSTKAEPDSYKMLPPICKRKEDGGGPQKGKPCNIPPENQ